MSTDELNHQIPAEADAQVVDVDLGFSQQCKATCTSLYTSAQGMIERGFIADTERHPGQFVVAYIPLRDFTAETYEKHVRKEGHASAAREANKARRAGFYCKPFPRRLHIPDIHDINTSTPDRGGKPMAANYLRSVAEMGGAPKRPVPLPPHRCPLHNQTYFGVFERAEGHMQGDVRTDERLVAYLSLNRYGNCAIYTLFLGHFEYRKQYVMNLLHFETLREIWEGDTLSFDGLDYLMYHRYTNQNPGLTFWKRKMGFFPGYWVNRGEPVAK